MGVDNREEPMGAGMDSAEHDNREYRVVVNGEEQYSVWFAERELPSGWWAEGTTGSKDECLAHIAEIWTDMRPLSLRRRMDAEPAGN